MVEGGNGWPRYETLVLDKLNALGNDVKALERQIADLQSQEIGQLKVEVAMLKVKSGLWGAAAGFLPASLLVAFQLMQGT